MSDKAALPKKRNLSILSMFTRMIAERFKCTPVTASLFCFCDILHAAGYVLVVVFSQQLFDGVTRVANGEPLSQAFWPLLYLGLSSVLLEVANGLSNFPTEYLSPKVLSRLHQQIYAKASRISPIEFERPEFLDRINKALQGVETGYFASLLALMLITFYLPYFVFMGIYLQTLTPSLIFTLIFIFVPVIVGQGIRLRLFAKVEDDIAPVRREMDYYEKAICDREYFKETRLLGGFQYFINLYRDAIVLVNKKTMSAEMHHVRIDLILRIFTIVGYVGILIMLVRSLISGQISAGAFAAVFASVGTMYGLAEEVFGGFMNRITRYAATIRNYQKFMDLPERTGKPGVFDAQKGLLLRDVCFQYPNADKQALRGITLNIAPGETVAIVGENGAGKSTLVKLLLGLYQPTSGKVLIGGLDTSLISDKSIYLNSSAVFQKYQRYRATLEENVSISDIRITDDSLRDQVADVCDKADLDLNTDSFPDGQKTMLSREFDGVDLSGGQWQRVAIARGLYRTHHIIVLDEPTSAIDPIEETRVYHQFAELSKGKISIIVTHRLGSAQIADRIVVLNNGLIDDIGTHEQLMKRAGMYAAMYHAQAKWYKR